MLLCRKIEMVTGIFDIEDFRILESIFLFWIVTARIAHSRLQQ